MDLPETRYAKSGDVRIAYQVTGSGPFDLVFVPGFVSNLDLAWESPAQAHFFSRLSAFSRLILFDKHGTGLSDRVSGAPDLEVRMDDVRAVMDATGCERAAVFGVSEGGAMSMLFAATYPERTRALVLYGTYAHYLTWVLSGEKLDAFIEAIELGWGTGETVRFFMAVRSGLHTGEIEIQRDDVGGIAVHIAARVVGLAGTGEVLVSSTVRDLVAGSGL